MQQMLLDISTQKTPSLETFVAGKNAELLRTLHHVALRELPERFIYLWGDAATGKTHLLKALAQYPGSRYIEAISPSDDFFHDPAITLYLLDDCDKLSPEKQIAAFSLFNEAQENHAFFVASGAVPPSLLPVREDLKSRMSWGLAYCIHTLADEEKMDALGKTARKRGVSLSPDVLPYLVTHYPRDMRSLTRIFDALDRYSLQTKRTITLPLLREMMQKAEHEHE